MRILKNEDYEERDNIEDDLWEDHGKNGERGDDDKGESAVVLFLLTDVKPNSNQNIVCSDYVIIMHM